MAQHKLVRSNQQGCKVLLLITIDQLTDFTVVPKAAKSSRGSSCLCFAGLIETGSLSFRTSKSFTSTELFQIAFLRMFSCVFRNFHIFLAVFVVAENLLDEALTLSPLCLLKVAVI